MLTTARRASTILEAREARQLLKFSTIHLLTIIQSYTYSRISENREPRTGLDCGVSLASRADLGGGVTGDSSVFGASTNCSSLLRLLTDLVSTLEAPSPFPTAMRLGDLPSFIQPELPTATTAALLLLLLLLAATSVSFSRPAIATSLRLALVGSSIEGELSLVVASLARAAPPMNFLEVPAVPVLSQFWSSVRAAGDDCDRGRAKRVLSHDFTRLAGEGVSSSRVLDPSEESLDLLLW